MLKTTSIILIQSMACVLLLSFSGCKEDVAPGTCSDEIKNQDETGIDCGGICKVCVTPDRESCFDSEHNQDEGGIDCGGVCPRSCPTCSDGIRNGTEEGPDCGGTCPDACLPDPCKNGDQDEGEEGIDCGGTCEPCRNAPTCSDGARNGDETKKDCGGSCPACPTCFDGQQNGEETGEDCGGPDCEDCATVNANASCTDGIISGNEEGIDCGGACPNACSLQQGDACVRDDDVCLDDGDNDVRCILAQELDAGSARLGTCREQCANDTECDGGQRCVPLYKPTADATEYALTRAPGENLLAENFCTTEPAANSRWRISVDLVEVDGDDFFENPDIMVCFDAPGSVLRDYEDARCIYDADQDDRSLIENSGSLDFTYNELAQIKVIVLDLDRSTPAAVNYTTNQNGVRNYRWSGFMVALDTFDLRPNGVIRPNARQTLFGDQNTFQEVDESMERIYLSISPVP